MSRACCLTEVQRSCRRCRYLSAEDYRPHVVQWAESQGVQILHHRLNVNKEPFGESECRVVGTRSARRLTHVEVDEDVVAAALADILDRRNLPVLIHCNKGEHPLSLISTASR